MMKQFLHGKRLESHSSDILGIFVTLPDANNFVYNHCASHPNEITQMRLSYKEKNRAVYGIIG
jgi:hypothetical protein